MINKQLNQIAVLFDMDGVIVDNMLWHLKAWKIFYEKYSIPFSTEDFKQQFGRTNKQILCHLFNRQVNDDEAQRLGEEKEKIYRDIYTPHIKPAAGLIEFLQALKSNGIKTAVATSAPPENASFVLDNLQLHTYFDAVVDATHITKGKPDPEVFLKSAQALGASPDQCIVFEDSLAGIKAGNNALMKVIGITTTHLANELSGTVINFPDFRNISLNDLLNVING